MSGRIRPQPQPQRQWYVVALSKDVVRKPRSVVLLDRAYVLYRDLQGQPVAHVDRCPHRNVPLSGGRCLDDDTIECPYHGWTFSPDGQCVSIPGLTKKLNVVHRVQSFATRDAHGFVWVCPDEGGREPLTEPLVVPQWQDLRYICLARQVNYPAGVHAVVENALDVPHTSILHRGLFRAGPRNRIRVVMRRFLSWAEAEYLGEPVPTGLVARLLSLGAEKELSVQHWDRFILPSTLQVEYRLGERIHFLITGFCLPQHADSTEVFVQVCIRTPLRKWLVRPFIPLLELLAMRVYRQDVEVLQAQTRVLNDERGETFISTEIDVLGGAVSRLIKDARDAETHSEAGEGQSAEKPSDRNQEDVRQTRELELDA